MWTHRAKPMNQIDHNNVYTDVIATDGTITRQQATTGAGLVQKVDTPELDPVPRPTGD